MHSYVGGSDVELCFHGSDQGLADAVEEVARSVHVECSVRYWTQTTDAFSRLTFCLWLRTFARIVFELMMIVAHVRTSFAFSQCGREAPNWSIVGCNNLDSAAKSHLP